MRRALCRVAKQEVNRAMWGLSQKEKNKALAGAFWSESPARVEAALKKGGDPDAKLAEGKYPVIWAAESYSETRALAILDSLVEHKANLNIKDGTKTALSAAIENGHVRIYKELLKNGADPGIAGGDEKTVTALAIRHQNWQVLEDLFSRDIAQRDMAENAASLFLSLIERGAPLNLVKKALEVCDVNATDGRRSALMLAVTNGREDVFHLLMTQPKLDVNLLFRYGRDALYHAIERDKSDMAVTLIEHGADVTGGNAQQDGEKRPDPFNHAVSRGNIVVLRAVLKKLEDRGLAKELDLTAALFRAVALGKGQTVSLLIKEGAVIDGFDANGQTLATVAAQNGHTNLLKLLARHGLDLLATDKNGVSPLEHSVDKKHFETRDYLQTQQPGYVPPPPPVDRDRFFKASNTTLDVREKGGLTMSFNFFTQQLVYRDPERGGAISVQNFADVQRQEAISEAYDILKRLGGDPPDPAPTANKPAALKMK
jgi:ankyrin repeat protein